MNVMESKLPVTVLIAAKNEEANIEKCLLALQPAQRIILLDSSSEDKTAEIALRHRAEVVNFRYAGGYPKKRQWALDNLPIHTEWIFLLDADEVVPPELWEEIRNALDTAKNRKIDAFAIKKGFHFLGRRFRFGGFSHKAVLLFRKGKARFELLLSDFPGFYDMEVHERLLVDGVVKNLSTPLIHEDFKGLTAYIDRHNKYATWEATLRYNYLTNGHYGNESIKPNLFGNVQEKRRFLKKLVLRLPLEPFWWFFYHYICSLGFLEGQRGLIASLLRLGYLVQIRSKVYERKLLGTTKEVADRHHAPVIRSVQPEFHDQLLQKEQVQ